MSTTLGTTIYSVARQLPAPFNASNDNSGPATLLVSFDTETRKSSTTPISLPPGDPLVPQQWTAIIAIPAWAAPATGAPTAVPRQPLALLGLRAVGDGTFTYQVRRIGK